MQDYGIMALTGRFTLRRTWTGRIVLQVEDEKRGFFRSRNAPPKRVWRDATLMDLAAPEMRPLIDLRYKPHYLTPGLQADTPQAATEPVRTEPPAEPAAQPEPRLQSYPGQPIVEARPNRTSH
jgi:hypothetical protein